MEYLRGEFERPELKTGARLPTNRELAERLQVSVPTVQAVMRRLAQEGRIETRGGGGTYLVQTRRVQADRLTFAIGLPVPGSLDDPWNHGIYGGMLSAALRSPIPISLQPACRDAIGEKDVARTLFEQRRGADGLILFPFPRTAEFHEEVRSAYESEGKPVVMLNPPSETATSNFVSPDYLGASHQLGKAWKQTDRRHVVLLLDPPFQCSTSARLRWAGLNNAFGTDLGGKVSCTSVLTHSAPGAADELAYRTVKEILAKGIRPDALFTVGDYQALGALRALREAGLNVPGDVSVVGGTGLNLTTTTCPQLTRMWQPLASIGEKLVEMLTQRIELGHTANNSVAGIYLPAPFVGGGTTRTSENELLGIPANT
jgi:DNA-binding LacI/PurR family transcriptional regulator